MNTPLRQVAAGWNHTLALTEKGQVYGTGLNDNGQLGTGDMETQKEFILVYSTGHKQVSSIFAGGNCSWLILDKLNPIQASPT